MPTLTETLWLMRGAHAGQTDRAGKPYHLHPEGVLAILLRLNPESEQDALHAALLHDVFEDTRLTAQDLRRFWYSERVVHLVLSLSRPGVLASYGTTYHDQITTIVASGDRELIEIKLADVTHNMLPERILSLPKAESLLTRYTRAKATLEAGLGKLSGGIQKAHSQTRLKMGNEL